jgi:hypothetical protein
VYITYNHAREILADLMVELTSGPDAPTPERLRQAEALELMLHELHQRELLKQAHVERLAELEELRAQVGRLQYRSRAGNRC